MVFTSGTSKAIHLLSNRVSHSILSSIGIDHTAAIGGRPRGVAILSDASEPRTIPPIFHIRIDQSLVSKIQERFLCRGTTNTSKQEVMKKVSSRPRDKVVEAIRVDVDIPHGDADGSNCGHATPGVNLKMIVAVVSAPTCTLRPFRHRFCYCAAYVTEH